MPCHTKMKLFPQGLFGLILFLFNCLVVLSLEPGYLDFDNLPDTNFTCVGKVIGGYYADLETNCQMFHVCTIGQLDEPMDIRFLCLNGTVFDQETRVCERIDEVDCSKSEQFYSLNLELYGNTQPPILEEDPSEDNEKSYSTPSSTASSTTKRSSISKPTVLPFYTSTSSPTSSTLRVENVITSHHFPVANNPDIRFNPEEINVSLNADAPPNIIRSEVPVSFQHQSFSNSESNTKVTITTHTNYKDDGPHHISLSTKNSSSNYNPIEEDSEDDYKLSQTVLTPKSIVSYGLTHNDRSRYKNQHATPKEVNYGFNYQQTRNNQDLLEGSPTHPFYYQLSKRNYSSNSAQNNPYQTTTTTTTYRQSKHQFSTKSPETEKYSQLPLPLFPTLSPLSFSSPSPFSVSHHSESKRFTQDHHAPPRVVISASASVSDNNGRRLNYSLGTIGASHLLGPSPPSYDDYKEEDVILDPFYHDVPKIKSLRHKRSALNKEDLINNEEEAADLLKFLFEWYETRKGLSPNLTIPSLLEDIAVINHELAPLNAKEGEVSDERHENVTRGEDVKNATTYSDEVKLVQENKNEEESLNLSEFSRYGEVEQSTSDTNLIVTTLSNIVDDDETPVTFSKFHLQRKISDDSNETENSIEQNFDYEEELESKSTENPSNEIQDFTDLENKTEKVHHEESFDFADYPDYVNDNYEPLTYQEHSTSHNTENIERSMILDETTTNFDYDTTKDSSTQEEEEEDHSSSTLNFTTTDFVPTSNEIPATTDFPYLTTTAMEPDKTTIGGDIFLQLKTTTDNYEYSTTSPISTSVENWETTSSPLDFTTLAPTSTTRTQYLKTRPPWYSRKYNPKATKPQRTINVINNKIVSNLNSVLKSNFSEDEKQLSERNSKIKATNKMLLKPLAELMKKRPTTTTTTPLTIENELTETFITTAPLLKSVIPTRAKYTKIVFSTTPLSKLIRVELRKDLRGRGFSFNCFDKKVHQFYSDPRDCRLFHYCTWGYKRTQMVDMKFVCDFGTYFDDEKLICSKVKPTRCI